MPTAEEGEPGAGGGPRRESGAAAVEFAIILPLLLIFVGGIIDFGRLFYAEIMVTNAAREGARMVALGPGFEEYAFARADAASPNLEGAFDGLVEVDVDFCPNLADAASYTVRTARFDWVLLDAFADISAPQPQSTATMRCGG